jgi:acyl carrier protein
MDMAVYDRVTAVLADYISERVPAMDIHSSLVNDLGMDSLEMIAAATSLENEFGIRIPVDVMAELTTVEDLTVFIGSRLSARGSHSG